MIITRQYYQDSLANVSTHINSKIVEKIKNKEYLLEDEYVSEDLKNTINNLLKVVYSNDSVLSINDVVNNIIQVDSINKIDTMIKNVNLQNDVINSIAINSKELADATESVACSVEKVTEYTNDATDKASEVIDNINKSIENIVISFNKIYNIKNEVNEVENDVKNINGILDIIKEIANQTSLLSLNAAIEASRAGEMGKGFSVVANEIKKLAEYTKNSIKTIDSNIVELTIRTKSTIDFTDNTIESLKLSKDKINEIPDYINKIMEYIRNIQQELTNISAMSQEQSVSTSTISDQISDISQSEEELKEMCKNVGIKLLEIGNYANLNRINILENANLSTKENIAIYKVDHLLWVWKIYSMILGLDKVDENQAENYKGCRLGKWYYQEYDKYAKDNSYFRDLEEKHISLHKEAKEAVVEYKNNNLKECEKHLNNMFEISVKVIKILDDFDASIDR